MQRNRLSSSHQSNVDAVPEANYTHYCRPEVEKLLDLQSQQFDLQERKAMVWEIERTLAEDVARPIIYHNCTATCWHPHVKGALRGFVTVTLPIGLKLIDCPVLASNGKAWVNLPAKPVLDRDGKQKIGADGKPAYAAILEWRSRELSDGFSEAVIAAIRQMHPGALDGVGS